MTYLRSYDFLKKHEKRHFSSFGGKNLFFPFSWNWHWHDFGGRNSQKLIFFIFLEKISPNNPVNKMLLISRIFLSEKSQCQFWPDLLFLGFDFSLSGVVSYLIPQYSDFSGFLQNWHWEISSTNGIYQKSKKWSRGITLKSKIIFSKIKLGT